ncbi:hypothetical protein BG003_007010 [Podila horticola]|nr:hypothetical protein BG003_007010 [Podila horticola]
MLLSKASLALITASILLLLISHTEAHSYSNCIDWRFNSKNKSWANSNGHCAGYAPHFTLGAKNPPCSNGRSGEESGTDETMAKPWTADYNGKDKRGRKTGTYTVTKVGGNLCIRWPARNHAVPEENDLSTINFGISEVNLTEDPHRSISINTSLLTWTTRIAPRPAAPTPGHAVVVSTSPPPSSLVTMSEMALETQQGVVHLVR